MSESTTSESVLHDDPSQRNAWKAELVWILPLIVAVLGITIFLMANLKWGANFAAVLALPIEVAAVLMPLLIDRGLFKRATSSRELRRLGRLRWVAMFIAGALLISGGAFYFTQREPDPFEFLSGTVRIGYLDTDRYPGWNTGDDNTTRTGFDVAVVRAIQSHFSGSKGFNVEWVPLKERNDRVDALRGKWGDQRDQEPVKLVVSNLSITPQRQHVIDFAGPYFVDTVGFLTHQKNDRLADLTPGKVCVPKGATAAEKLTDAEWEPTERDSLERCIYEFFTNRDPRFAVSTDLAILQSSLSEMGVSGASVPWTISDFGLGVEKYGVGIPDNSPKLCAEINKALQDFLDSQWEDTFASELGSLGLRAGHRMPGKLAECERGGSWWPF